MTDQIRLPKSAPRPQIAMLLIGLAAVLVLTRAALPEGLIRPPDWLILPFADWVNTVFTFLRDDLGLMALTRAFAGMVEWLLDVTANILYGKSRWPRLGPLPWSVVAITMAALGAWLGGWRLAVLAGGTFTWIAVMGQWQWAMETLSVIAVAAPFSIVTGLLLGIAAWRFRLVARVLDPVLNIAQSLPHFAYMIPVVVFIGVGPKAGAIVTIIFSVPPMIRMTALGLAKVPDEVVEAGRMGGATPFQLLRKVRLPTARTEILVGVNQVIMQCLAMVVLASFIGMPGLGQKLLQLLQALKIGLSVEIGITIVLIAVVLDRLTRAWAMRQPQHHAGGLRWWQRHPVLLAWALAVVLAFALAQIFPILAQVPRREALSIAAPIDLVMDQVIRLVDPLTTWLRWFLITWVLIPLRDAIQFLPFSAILLAVAAAGWAIGGWRSALVVGGFIALIAVSGWWDRAMITVYMVGFSVCLAALIGFPLGIWAARGEARAQRMLLICDTLQTFPSFIYLIPVVMLFGVNDVAVVMAVVTFAAVPLIRYTTLGLRGVAPELIEAAQMSGATRRQLLWQVQLPMALPVMMVGVNQSVMFSLFMVIIAAFIGTQDLGQELQRALSASDVGKGMVLGLAVAFLGLAVDHLIRSWSRNRAA
ncbi:ABC transporter permease subunit [Xinfangfangia sp. D13-10-4-6]|uniref:ABC transporter permease n=1 Tax=Pseudogemmobacter hezensis TaxID=2737662 RepID=UPI001555F868|nr:ABC transporter permease subunit [Pseudogemmobacter hezensis]NPD14786.1 ABC transporter permease subunit [Pseudogemmobacter hezensis]